MDMVGKIIEGTVTLIILYLVLSNADSFGTVAQAIGTQYTGAVKTLQGR
jgi:hypothetical protein